MKRGRPRSQAAHDAILETSIALVREMGFDAVSIDAIAARAGVGKATIYRRWRSKEAVVCAALAQLMHQLPTPDTGTTLGDLRALMKSQRGLYSDPATAELLSGLIAAMHRSKAIAKVVRGSFHAAREAAMAEVLKRGMRRGDVKRSLDLQLALDLFNGPLFYRFLFTGRPIDDRLATATIDALLSRGASRALS